MKTRIVLLMAAAAAFIAGCATRKEPPPPPAPRAAVPEPKPAAVVPALTLDEYKAMLARHIARHNGDKVYSGRPQALLRSVVVVQYEIDAHGNLVHTEIMRSNRDRHTEAAALHALRSAAPFPPPSPNLLQRGRLRLAETWLFNSDGRFQLRTIALPQMDR